MDDFGFGGPLKEIVYENTYITSPEGYGKNASFQRHKVKEVLDEMLKQRLDGQEYDPVKSSQISKMLSDDLREKVRVALHKFGESLHAGYTCDCSSPVTSHRSPVVMRSQTSAPSPGLDPGWAQIVCTSTPLHCAPCSTHCLNSAAHVCFTLSGGAQTALAPKLGSAVLPAQESRASLAMSQRWHEEQEQG